MPRSIRLAPECIPQVKLALRRHGFPSQKAFAVELGRARATIDNFFKGIPIDFINFVEISERLGLDWQAIAYADYLLRLMKQRTDALVATDEKLQQFLMWVNEKSLSVEVPYKLAAVRAFYFAVAVARDMAGTQTRALSGSRDIARALNLNINHTPNFDIIVDLNLGRIFARAHALTHTLDDAFASHLDFDFSRPFAYILNLKLDLEFEQALQQLKTQLPAPFDAPGQELPLLKTQLPELYDEEIFKQWWQANGQAWLMQLREVMISYRNIGHDWHFSYQQMKGLRQYYDANKLLVDCLNRAADVTPAMRSHIEEKLLLPIALIEKTGSCRDK